MNAPLYEFILKYSSENIARFHVPGHKGRWSETECCDITEIKGADVLYHENGILEESQKNAAYLFGTRKTLYSAEGSSLCIRAMLALVKMYAEKIGKKPTVAAGRNAHKVFMTASALLGIEVDWLASESVSPLVSCKISSEGLAAYLENCSALPVAVYITSPDYLGNMADIKGLSEVCHRYSVLLIVDNAHGAYLNFLPENMHPIFLGADMCCDSAHKTLPVLTGGAYLHISKEAPLYLAENAKKSLALFASTSPSYLILSSLDEVNLYLDRRIEEDIAELLEIINKCKGIFEACGRHFIGDEPLKITFPTKEFGYHGDEVADILRENQIECEYSDPDFVVCMISPFNSEDEIYKLFGVILCLPEKSEIKEAMPILRSLERKMSVKDALFAPSKNTDIASAKGKILADACVTCPPAVPVAICGEVLDDAAVECFKYYGIESVNIVDEEV